jgi:hypothetical protein
MVMLSEAERAAIDRIAAERNISLRDLVVSAILDSEPTGLLQRVLEIEARLLQLEAMR